MAHLFLVYLGGRTEKSNIELHDVRFVACETRIEESFDRLRAQWFGRKRGLHLDAWIRIHHADGFRVELRRDAPSTLERLFFVNIGGYDPDRLAELHDFGLFVAPRPAEAAGRAKKTLLPRSRNPHKDDLRDVDDLLALDAIDGWRVHLVRDGVDQPLRPDWFGYRLIDGSAKDDGARPDGNLLFPSDA